MEVQNAGQLKNIFDEKNPVHIGFKTAFYEYTEQNEKQMGSQVNRIYSMCINIYRRLPDIERAIKDVFSDSYEAEIRQPNMLIVLIYEGIIAGQKLKIGGKLSRMVKDNREVLTKMLGTENDPENSENTRNKPTLPKYAYLRLNKNHKKKQKDDSDDENPI